MDESSDDFRRYGEALVKWANELARRVGPDEAGRLLFAAGVAQLTNTVGAEGAAEFLRELADGIDPPARAS